MGACWQFLKGTHFLWVFELLAYLTIFHDCVMFHRQWMTQEAAQEAAQEARDCLQVLETHHQALCSRFLSEGRSLWYCIGKTEFAQHIANDTLTTNLNPRPVWTSGDEDFLVKIAQITKSSTRATGLLRLGHAMTLRWRNRAHVGCSRRARERTHDSWA